ncbi:MAG: serine/threonine protein phosphatase, partial [Saccharofermentans sp.]|nr:serine/threonine protein phosphatase [Saccharofermentans sp.]
MALFAIADLHLALSNPDKSMEIFGKGWTDYIPRLKEAFEANVTSEDTVLMPGDISWATYMKQAGEDFKFIDSLPGKKIIGRGNHDYWWTTVKKMEETVAAMGLTTISLSNHTTFETETDIITGTRSWKLPTDDNFSDEDRKIYEREKIRIGLCAKALEEADPEHAKRRVLMLH